jgi:REP element-mobilizing transposase RayT
MTGIVKHHKHKLLQINGTADHVHLLVGMRPTQAMADLMENVKSSSSEWINERRFLRYKFAWQEGYGVFSYSKDQVPKVIEYIQNQEAHHRKKTFREEYQWMLQQSMGDDYEARYLFDELIDLGY